MRVADRALPTVRYDAVPEIADWPVRPVIAIQGGAGEIWDDPALVWDDPAAVWDGDTDGYVDATCAMYGLEVVTGPPDDHGTFPAASAIVQLDNADGRWSQFNADGTLAQHGIGSRLHVWAHNAGGDWWLFSGTIDRVDQRADDTVEIEAVDAFSDLAQPVGTYTAGAAGQQPGARLAAILTAAGRTDLANRFAAGVVTLTAQATDSAPLEEMEIVVSSDGGLLFGDADGTLISTDRTWPAGRADQTNVPTVSDNICNASVVVWDPLISTNDVGVGQRVIVENIAKLQGHAGNGKLVYTDTGLQFTTQTEGDILAAFLADTLAAPRLRLETFDLYLLDHRQPDLWQAVDWRLLDVLRFGHDARVVGGTTRVDLNVLVYAITHSVTPGGQWVMSVGTTKGLGAVSVWLYDTGHNYNEGGLYGF